MIAKFYNKFDELHEQSVATALAKSPNREQLKQEVKYRIPPRWTKKFHKYDIVDINVENASRPGIVQERGKVNKPGRVAKRESLEQEVQLRILRNAATTGLAPESSSALEKRLSGEEAPLSNTLLKSNIDSGKLDGIGIDGKGGNPFIDDAESTDVSKAGSPTKMMDARSSMRDRALYDWSEVAYLFEDG